MSTAAYWISEHPLYRAHDLAAHFYRTPYHSLCSASPLGRPCSYLERDSTSFVLRPLCLREIVGLRTAEYRSMRSPNVQSYARIPGLGPDAYHTENADRIDGTLAPHVACTVGSCSEESPPPVPNTIDQSSDALARNFTRLPLRGAQFPHNRLRHFPTG